MEAVKAGEKLVNGQFQKGDDPRRNLDGRNAGSKHFRTIFNEAIKKIAETEGDVPDPEKEIVVKAIKKAMEGNYPFIKDLLDRLYGKPKESLDVDLKGEEVHKWEVVIVDGKKDGAGSTGDTGDAGIQKNV